MGELYRGEGWKVEDKVVGSGWARVVGDGLWLIDLFDLAPPTAQQRGALIDMVEELMD